jgi:hypothetical protein
MFLLLFFWKFRVLTKLPLVQTTFRLIIPLWLWWYGIKHVWYHSILRINFVRSEHFGPKLSLQR